MNKKEQAIHELQRQIGRLNDVKYPKNDAWTNRTAALIRNYFGTESEQYDFIKNFKFLTGVYTPDAKQEVIDKNKGRAIQWLLDCIEAIEKYGLHKTSKPNFLYRIKEGWLIFWIGMTCAAMIAIGKALSDYQNVEYKQITKTQQDSITLYKSTIDSLQRELKRVKSGRIEKPNALR